MLEVEGLVRALGCDGRRSSRHIDFRRRKKRFLHVFHLDLTTWRIYNPPT
jgi:hypothetical protein